MARAVAKLTGTCVLTFELRRSADENLLDAKLQARIPSSSEGCLLCDRGCLCEGCDRSLL